MHRMMPSIPIEGFDTVDCNGSDMSIVNDVMCVCGARGASQ